MRKVILAGYNVDADQLGDALQHDACTPETISAAYARISRSPDEVGDLRRKAWADVAKARKSNQNIVFEMGHNSVAEHAVFNFDIVGVSRLCVEAIEHSRLVSYCEKSQRYLNIEDSEVVIPEELQGKLREAYVDVTSKQNTAYKEILALIKDKPRDEGGNAQEDARYVTCLGMTAQLGMTTNARSLEAMVRRLMAEPILEVRLVAVALHEQAKAVAPSLLRYCEPTPFRTALKAIPQLNMQRCAEQEEVCFIQPPTCGVPASPDTYTLAALMFKDSVASYDECVGLVESMEEEARWHAFKSLYSTMGVHDAAPREFELPAITMELVGSASMFAQLKRHRMATILPQRYDVGLGCTIPRSFSEDAAVMAVFNKVREETEKVYKHLNQVYGPRIAEYVLMQAHRRRVLVKMNARELYAFARLRMDGHAQHEIRGIAYQIVSKAKEVMPMTLALACGKDGFARECEVREVGKKRS